MGLAFRTKRLHVAARSDDGEAIGDLFIDLSVQCLRCAHLNDNLMSCSAFPDGIPDEITDGDFDHEQPYKGDRGIQYEPIKGIRS